MDLEALRVRHDEERWALQGLPVLQELLIGSGEVLVPTLVLDGEVVPVPDVGESLTASDLLDAFSKV